MLRRLKFFSIGVVISLLFLSMMGPENRLKDTLFAYIDYFNPEKRVISQLSFADSVVYSEGVNESLLLEFYKDAWVNHDISDKDSYPQYFVLDNILGGTNIRIHFKFYDNENSLENGKRVHFTLLEVIFHERGLPISSRSYDSYFTLIVLFLVIMIPVSLLIIRLIRRTSS